MNSNKDAPRPAKSENDAGIPMSRLFPSTNRLHGGAGGANIWLERAKILATTRREDAPAWLEAAPDKPREQLFRQEAMDHYLSAEDVGGPLRISPPWTWALFSTVAAGLLIATATSFLGHVEVTARGRGIVRPSLGVRTLEAQTNGVVVEVLAVSGNEVAANQPVMRLESADLLAQLLDAERRLALVRSALEAFASEQERTFHKQRELLLTRLAMTDSQIASQRSSVGLFERKLRASEELEISGLISQTSLDDAREALAQSERQLSVSMQAQATVSQELAALEARRGQDLWTRQQEVSAAASQRDALAFALRQLSITAPADGQLEAILVRVGDVVRSGQVVGKIVPREVPFQVVSFLAERDRAFVKQGDTVKLELDQLPYAEFGTLPGTVSRIADDLATPLELQDALGDIRPADPTYRVEIAVDDRGRRGPPLRTGMLVSVRYTLRRQRLIVLLLEPLRPWFD
jgi:membrane fusion protein